MSSHIEPLITTIGGCATIGAVLACAHELGRDDPRWDAAMGKGSVWGAVVGAALLAIDIVSMR